MRKLASPVLLIPLALSLLLLAADSAVRVHQFNQATTARFSPAPPLVVDTTTTSGYAGNQHNTVGPVRSIDGYQWTMQTQMMLKDHQWRIRHTDYDGPPGGREVHWAGFVRYWTLPFAWIAGKLNGTTTIRAAETVSPWVNTVLFVVVLLVVSAVVARRWGSLPAALFAVASVTVYLQYEMYSVGNYDHHGILSTCAILTALCAGAGGGGWVRADIGESQLKKDASLWHWLLDEKSARKWFIASGVSAGAGLWISAATQAPVIVALGAAAMFGTVFARSVQTGPWRIEPTLWRTWGIAGGATSLAFYLFEYFPSAPTLRLEVNHPLWALAWVAGGDLLCRLYRRAQPGSESKDTGLLVVDLVLIALLPAIAVLVPASFALRPGTLLFALHEHYIQEFQTIFWQFRQWTWSQINAGIGVITVVMAIPAVLLVRARDIPPPLRAVMLTVSGPAFAFTLLAMRHVRWIGIATALWIGVAITLCAIATIGRESWDGARARKVASGFALSAVFAIVPLLAVSDVSPRSVNATLAVITVAAAVWASLEVTRGTMMRWNDARLRMVGVCFGLVVLPHPIATAYNWTRTGVHFRASDADVAQLVSREVSQKLRARIGAERGTVLSGPSSSTWITYFGGMKTIATLYWENSVGITAASDIFGATPDSAQKLLDANGVTHIVIFSWDQEAIDYSRIHESAVRRSAGERSFAKAVLAGEFANWIRPVPYDLPKLPYLTNPWVLILEIAPSQTKEESLVRLAQFHLANGRLEEGTTAIKSALALRADYLPALIQLANVESGPTDQSAFRSTMARIKSSVRDTATLAYEDDAFLAIAADLAGDSVLTRQALSRAFAVADERSVRRLTPDAVAIRFLQLAHQYDAAKANPAMIELAMGLLSPEQRSLVTR